MKNRSDLMPKLISAALFLSFIAFTAWRAVAQDVVYDWESRKLISSPAQVNRTQSVNIVIKQINDILFEYKITVVATARNLDDWSHLSGLLAREASRAPTKPAPASPGCANQVDQAQALMNKINLALSNAPELPIRYKDVKPYKTVELKKSRAAWDKIKGDIDELRKKVNEIKVPGVCPQNDEDVIAFHKGYQELEQSLTSIENKVYSNHEVSEAVTLRPETDYKVTVEEFFEGTKTEGGEATFEFKPTSNQLTLTTGVLFSRIQDRGYESRKFPGMTENVLVVEGNSRLRPEGVALLNYLMPYLDSDTAGLALSAGPVIRFGSKSDLASLGFFTGVSTHLYRRFYVTPGVHMGQFADFPVGFHDGQAIPANFGELNPVKRWTARFAFGISFRTASFGPLTQAAKPAVTDNKPAAGKTDDKKGGKGGKGGGGGGGGGEDESASNISDTNPSFMRQASLRSAETKDGPRVTVTTDTAIGKYTTSEIDNILYVVIPNARAPLARTGLGGRGSGITQVEQSGKNLVLSFVVPRGMRARVAEKFNRLEVSFTAVEAPPPPTRGPVVAKATRD